MQTVQSEIFAYLLTDSPNDYAIMGNSDYRLLFYRLANLDYLVNREHPITGTKLAKQCIRTSNSFDGEQFCKFLFNNSTYPRTLSAY